MNRPVQVNIPEYRHKNVTARYKEVVREKGDIDGFLRSTGLNEIAKVRARGKNTNG